MSFDNHDRCRRCGDLDGPGHTATECERARARRREAQAAHDSQKTPPDSSLPLVTRRADGKHFRIVCQARSPDGPVDLVAVYGPPHERVSVSGREFVHLYDDPRRSPLSVSPTGVLCGHGVLCAWMREAVETTGSAFARREMEHPDTLEPVTRYVVSYANGSQRVLRACPACGGNPNEPAPVMRGATIATTEPRR